MYTPETHHMLTYFLLSPDDTIVVCDCCMCRMEVVPASIKNKIREELDAGKSDEQAYQSSLGWLSNLTQAARLVVEQKPDLLHLLAGLLDDHECVRLRAILLKDLTEEEAFDALNEQGYDHPITRAFIHVAAVQRGEKGGE